MSKRTNTPIGEVVCPHKGCDQVCKVYKFRPRTEGRKTVFSGKHYAECAVHGRIGSDGNPAVTNYILDEGKIWGDRSGAQKSAQKSAPAQAPAPKTPAAPSRSAPARSPQPSKQPERTKSSSKWWEPLI